MMIRDRTDGNLRPRHPWWIAVRTAAVLIGGTSAFYAFGKLPLAQCCAIIFSMPLIVTLILILVLGEKVGLHCGSTVRLSG